MEPGTPRQGRQEQALSDEIPRAAYLSDGELRHVAVSGRVNPGQAPVPSGFPCRSEVLPGNVSAPATLALTRLGRLLGDRPRPTVIMDAGLSTDETLA